MMRIDVWGPLRVAHQGRLVEARDFPGLKPKQLLEMLVLERGHAVSKSRLAEALWGESLPQNYPATLESYVSVLRQTLEPGGRARDSVIVTERSGYRLDAQRVAVDLDEFDQLVRDAAGQDLPAALAMLNDALRLVRGEVLEDERYAPWADRARSEYVTKHVQVLVDAGRLSLMTGEMAAASAFAERAVELDPFAEPACRLLMTASYATGRQDDALRAYDRCRRLLAEELGADPMGETVELHLAILRHEDVAALMPRPPSGSPRAPQAAGHAAGEFLGRHEELRRLQEGVAEAMKGRLTLMMVVGDPGSGKTQLADELSSRVSVPVGRNRCSDLEAQLPYVALSLALRPLLGTSRDTAMPVVSELLRRSDLAQPFDQFARMRVMESLVAVIEDNGPFVLVLDDAQWADPESIAALAYLQRRCPSAPVTVLLTSDRPAALREPLRGFSPDVRVDLGELTPADLASLGDEVYGVTHGLPLYVASWVEARRQGLPEPFTPRLRERVITRCWELGGQAYRCLTVAALLDEPFTAVELARLVGASDDLLEELDGWIDERLLVADGEAFRFRHPVVRAILAGTFSPAARARLCALASVAAEELPMLGPDVHAVGIRGDLHGHSVAASPRAPTVIPAQTVRPIRVRSL